MESCIRILSTVFTRGPGISKVHPFRIIYHVQRMGGWELQRTRSDYPNWTPLLRRLGKPPMWRAVSCILYIVFNTGCCLLPNSVHSGSFNSPKRWVRVAKKTKRLNTIFTAAHSGSSTVPNRWVRIARNAQRFIYNRLISPLMHELMQLHSRPFRIIDRAKQMGENC